MDFKEIKKKMNIQKFDFLFSLDALYLLLGLLIPIIILFLLFLNINATLFLLSIYTLYLVGIYILVKE
jgi:hypothetical protein